MTQKSDTSTGRFRTALTVFVVAALVFGAGCTGALTGGGGSGGAAPATDSVPANVDAIAYVDVSGAMNDNTLRDVTNTYLSLQAERSFGDPPSSVEEAVSQIENNTELDVDGLDAVTMFARTGEGQLGQGAAASDYGGIIVQSSWSESELVSAIENSSGSDLQESTYAGSTIYQSGSDDSYLGVLGDGSFVIGSEAAVRDALDVAAGNADAVSGDLVSAFEDTRDGYVRFAVTVKQGQVPTEQLGQTGAISNANIFNEVQVVSGAQYVSGDQIGMELTMTVPDEDTALNLRDVLRGAASWGRNTLNQSDSGSKFAGLIDRDSLSIEQSGSDVTVVSENSAEEIKSLIQTAYSAGAA
ncbi:MAG: hypothetical protein ABEJ68_01205 [Halobacteriaceae archaeon]